MDRTMDIVQEAVIKTIPKKKKCKKSKWLSEEALEIDEKRKDMKGKGEKERYTHLELRIQMLISFLFSFAFHFSSFHSYL